MTMPAGLVQIVVVLTRLGSSAATAAGGPSKGMWIGAWTFETDRQDRRWLVFSDPRGKTVFRIGCDSHFELDAACPGNAPTQEHTEPSITIGNGKTQMDFPGFTYAGPGSFPPSTSMFNRADLGHPGLADDQWRELEDRVLDLLEFGRPLRISAERRSYVLPAIKASRWCARSQKIC